MRDDRDQARRVGERLARFVGELSLDDAARRTCVEKLRCNLLHDLACAMAAHTRGPSRLGRGRATAARPRRPCCATAASVDAEHAAFANAALMHARAQDDTHFAAKTPRRLGGASRRRSPLAERDGADGATLRRAP